MKSLYSSPFRVYLVIGLLAIIGLMSGTKLPISLYPNSSRPTIRASVNFGHLNASEFHDKYGKTLEGELKAIDTTELEVTKVTSEYQSRRVSYTVDFNWGPEPKLALREVQSVLNGLSSTWPKEVRDSLWVNFWSKSSGFVAISYFSEERELNELHKILDPVLLPKLAKVKDAQEASLYNPNQKEVNIIFRPDVLTALGLFPKNVEDAISQHLSGMSGGSINQLGQNLLIEMPRDASSVEEFKDIIIKTPKNKFVHLSELAEVDLSLARESNRIFKTNGSKSLILFANPKTGGNVKRMAEETIKIVEDSMVELPKDVQYRVLVDPSLFIRSSINNVIHEVILAAFLAVLVLFIFIGSFKNTITAAIEIPLSMILAFVLMYLFDMNLNLISLGGLALAAGMNVDASVVVMENIFRHFEKRLGKLSFKEKLEIVTNAVKEVRFSILASTISTLVVFAPLAFTQDLTNAILGDLAKAVVFSHAFSMFIALIVVPTIRLQLLGKSKAVVIPKAPSEKTLVKLEKLYVKSLKKFIASKGAILTSASFVIFGLILCFLFIMPSLKREIVGKPDTDWMIVSVYAQDSSSISQMEEISDKNESILLERFGDDILYTFIQIQNSNSTTIMARLKDKSQMDRLWKEFEKEFQNGPGIYFTIIPWNPAELPLPDPSDMEIHISGGSLEDRVTYTKSLKSFLLEKEAFPRIWSKPEFNTSETISIKTHKDRLIKLAQQGVTLNSYDMADFLRVATNGKSLGDISIEDETYPLKLSFPYEYFKNVEDIEAIPILVKDKIIPLKGIANITVAPSSQSLYLEDSEEIVKILGKENQGKKGDFEKKLILSKQTHKEFLETKLPQLNLKSKPVSFFVDSKHELSNALNQLGIALGLSILLIFFTLLLQFSSFVHGLIILVAVPLGIIGGGISLYIFNSTLSLNSVLGMILLNGIAVNNSIILVDFILKGYNAGMKPIEAALVAAKMRLRPILITSITTILGMIPIAIGSGEGGKILSPLGISVAGGLWFSMVFTLFFVPMLEVHYLNWKDRRKFKQNLKPEVSNIVKNIGSQTQESFQ